MSALSLLYIALAAFYSAYSLTNSDGPFKIFWRIRRVFPLGGLTKCFVCMVFWTALLFFLFEVAGYEVIVLPFAVAGAAALLFRYTGGSANL